VTVAFIAATGQLYAHQNKTEILVADREGYAANIGFAAMLADE
jgi:hypothetical protein